MTFHTSTSTSRVTRRAAVGLIALALLLSGCSAGSAAESSDSTPSATPTPTVDPHALAVDIAATFPTEAEWLENYQNAYWCTAQAPGLDSCGEEWAVPGTVSNGFNLRDGATGVTASAIVLQLWEYDADEEAQTRLDEVKAKDIVFAGDFDIAANAETGAARSMGTGTLVDFKRSDWAGYRLSQVSVTTDPDGTSASVASSTNSILMTNGPLALMLRVYSASAEPGVADAEVNAWLDRVFGPEESD